MSSGSPIPSLIPPDAYAVPGGNATVVNPALALSFPGPSSGSNPVIESYPQPPPSPPQPAPFVPTLPVAGAVLWYRADFGIALNHATVNGWNNMVGADPQTNLVQPTVSKQPTYNWSDPAYNTRPTLSFAGAADQYMTSGVFATAIPEPNTVFVVGNNDGSTLVDESFVDTGATSINENSVLTAPSHGHVALYAGNFVPSAFVSTGQPLVIGGIFNSPTSALYINSKSPIVLGDPGPGGFQDITVGNFQDFVSGPLFGKVAEVIVYPRALSLSEIDQVMTYLGVRYGIAIGP